MISRIMAATLMVRQRNNDAQSLANPVALQTCSISRCTHDACKGDLLIQHARYREPMAGISKSCGVTPT